MYTRRQYLKDSSEKRAAIEWAEARIEALHDEVATRGGISPAEMASVTDRFSALYDEVKTLEDELSAIERRWNTRNWTHQDWAHWDLVSANVD